MLLKDLPEKERPRERLLAYGTANLSDQELLTILIGSGTQNENARDVAGRVLQQFSLEELSIASPQELVTIAGIGNAKACRLLAAFELHHRLQYERAPQHITEPAHAATYCTALIGHLGQEHVLIVFLDARNHVKGHHLLTKGLTDSSLIHQREVFKEAVRMNAHSIIVAHNHPSGDPEPSAEDRQVTTVLRDAGELLGIPLLDHIIVTRKDWRRV
jgi:DNA repair protein RadC